MTQLIVTEAAKAVGKDRKTLYRHIKEGRLNATKNHDNQAVVDVAELIRVYGPLRRYPESLTQGGTVLIPPSETGQQDAAPPAETGLLREMLEIQRKTIDELRADREAMQGQMATLMETVAKVTALLEDKRERKPEPKGFWARLFGGG